MALNVEQIKALSLERFWTDKVKTPNLQVILIINLIIKLFIIT